MYPERRLGITRRGENRSSIACQLAAPQCASLRDGTNTVSVLCDDDASLSDCLNENLLIGHSSLFSAAPGRSVAVLAARQKVSDRHAASAALLEDRIAGFNFRLHGLAAGLRRVAGITYGSAKFPRGDHDCFRAIRGGATQLLN
jgi:hypothetical protein